MNCFAILPAPTLRCVRKEGHKGYCTANHLEAAAMDREENSEWKEVQLSSSYRCFERPAELKWDLSINRYGRPHAKLTLMGLSSGTTVMETDLPEGLDEEVFVTRAIEWAKEVVETGEAWRKAMFGTPDK